MLDIKEIKQAVRKRNDNQSTRAISVTSVLLEPSQDALSSSWQQPEQVWRLNIALQQSLEVETVIHMIWAEFSSFYQVTGCEFYLSPESIDFQLGQPDEEVCIFQLLDADWLLGEMRFFRGSSFTPLEIAGIKQCLACAIFPLRNALQYHKALSSSLTDGLTQVGNRTAMEMSLQQEMDIANRYQQSLSVAMLDIDHFKRINDEFGHAAGDDVLAQIGKILTHNSRGADRVFRYGGEEFVLLFNKTDINGASIITERLRQVVADTGFEHQHMEISVTISLGLSHFLPNDSIATLLNRADMALYEAKKQGRNQVVIAEEHLGSYCA